MAAAVVPLVTSVMRRVKTTRPMMVVRPPSRLTLVTISARQSVAPEPLRSLPMARPLAKRIIMPHMVPF